MEFDKKEFRKKFPNIYKELGEPLEEGSSHPEKLDDEGQQPTELEPQIESYLRRARTVNEALEIVSYLEKRGEISESNALELKREIEKNGVRSFGPLRSWGHYEREFRPKTPRRIDYDDEEDEQEAD